MELLTISKLATETPRKTALRVIFAQITRNRLTFNPLQG